MKAIHYREPKKLIEDFTRKRTYPLPANFYRIKLTTENPNQNHYCYIFEFGYKERWIFDEATDYSGTGGRFFEEMEKFYKTLKDAYQNKPHFNFFEYEMPFKVYWLLYNLFYNLFSQPPEKREVF
jgi:hypothetical protein